MTPSHSIAKRAEAAASDPFALSAPQSNSFGSIWRRDYIPIDAGFSCNKHDRLDPVGFPLVELLAAIGLTHARPGRPDRRNKLEYVYGVAGRARATDATWLPPCGARSDCLPFSTRRFRMQLGWPAAARQHAAAVRTLRHGGSVHVLPRGEMPEDVPVAAILRY